MANAVYPRYKQALLAGLSDVSLIGNTVNDSVYVALVNTNEYTYSPLHQFYTDLRGIVGTPQRILSPTVFNGVFDGNDVVFARVTGARVSALVLYRRNAGSSNTWRLVAYLDTGISRLPVTPDGSDIAIRWSNSGILRL